ncbi:MAG: DUF349 domain-containing protein [Terrimesophilobacter sp.]
MAENQAPWGRADETGTVYVRTADGERVAGQFPDGTPEEALAYFERKFTELAGQVTLLEQRVKRGASASDVTKAVDALRSNISDAPAVGDLATLEARLDALHTVIVELSEKQSAEAKAELEAEVAKRAALVDEVEALAAQDFAKAQWKQVSSTLDALFEQWQKQQQDGPRLPKGESNDLWKRFRAARTTIETHRRAFFAELDTVHKDARVRKQELIEKAEALIPQGADGIKDYRTLLDDWKSTGRAGKKADDALWARFKAAGDALYGAKAEIDARDNAEFSANLEKKLALLDEAEPLLSATDRDAARSTLADIQRRWDEAGKVPRDKVKSVEDRMRKVEAAVRKLDDDFWQKNSPEKKARSQGLASQLEEAIAKLEKELADARTGGDKKAIASAEEALEARKAWLGAIG